MFKLINKLKWVNSFGCIFCDELCDSYQETGCAPFDICPLMDLNN